MMLAICALLLIVLSIPGPREASPGYSEGCTLPGSNNGRYVGKQPGDVLEEGHSVEVQCDPGTTNRVNGRLKCMSPMLDRVLPFCLRDCKLEAGDRLLVGTNFHLSAPLTLPHQYSVTLQCQEGYGRTDAVLLVFCDDGRLSQPRDLAFCTKETYITDCSEAATANKYTIVKSGIKIKVYCQVDETGKWTVIQRRQDGSVNFYRDWLDYQQGFGDVAGEHWLGNNNIHALTAAGFTRLRVELEDWDKNNHTVYYNVFRVAAAGDMYRLTVSGFRGSNPPGDSLTRNDGYMFTTYDKDNDMYGKNCASLRGGGWWYSNYYCGTTSSNGEYNGTGYKSIYWRTWRDWYSLKMTTMMVQKP